MLSICEDAILNICQKLTDYEKIQLIMTSKLLIYLRHKFVFTDKVNIDKIIELSYFDNFEYVKIYGNSLNFDQMLQCLDDFECGKICGVTTKFPKKVKHIDYGNKVYDTIILIYDNIPSSVTHLTLSAGCRIRTLAASVRYVKFRRSLDDKITLQNLPSVKYLIYGYYYGSGINNKIPRTVTHLIFGKLFDSNLHGINIPSSVTHLGFCNFFYQDMVDKIPLSVIELRSKRYINKITDERLLKIIR